MAKDKKAIVVYADWISIFNKLSDDEAGRLIKHFFGYVNDQNPTAPDRLTDIIFEPIKQQLKRDLKKYEAMCLRNKSNGEKGGRPKQTDKNPNNPVGLNGNPKNPTEPDTDTDTDTDNETEIKKRKRAPFKKPSIEEVKNFFDENGYDPEFGATRWHYYNDANWFDSHGNPVLNWKQKMRSVWFKPENEKKVTKLAV